MKEIFCCVWGRFLCLLGRLALSLRYLIRIEGLETIRNLSHKTLILPNHPGLIDPVIIMAYLWPLLRPRPALYSEYFRKWPLSYLMKTFRAVEFPMTGRIGPGIREEVEKAIQEVIGGLGRGENLILWPAAHIYSRPSENLGAGSGLARILREVPEAQIVVVRTTGLWGSMFGFAPTGKPPDLGKCIPRALAYLLAGLFFFLPRRSVLVTIEHWKQSLLPEPVKEKINRFFEEWYNAGGPEPPTYVPYNLLLGPRRYAFPPVLQDEFPDLTRIKPEILSAVIAILEKQLGRPLSENERKSGTRLEVMGLDSLDRMEVTLALERRFSLSASRVPETLGQAAVLAEASLSEKTVQKEEAPARWFSKPSRGGLPEILAETLAEAFIRRCLSNSGKAMAADDISGVLTGKRMLTSVLLLSRRLACLEDENIGVLLPSSVSADIAFMALHFIGRLPVMLNWTTGPIFLSHAVRKLKVRHVLTSRKFIERTGLAVEGASFVFLEDVRAGIGHVAMLRTVLEVTWKGQDLLRMIPRPSPEGNAVVLFTSGSEKDPKAVPLSHRNLISNLRGGIEALHLDMKDSLMAFLPPFHSFGLTATMLLPMLTGLRVVHHPDPTDSAGLLRKISAYRPTLLLTTPTFLQALLERAQAEDLLSLRIVIAGAEKCPMHLFKRLSVLAPETLLLEGYGITECSPIISVNRPGAAKPGTIGQPLPGVEIRIVDPETYQPLPRGAMGMILVSGPNVFSGYLNQERESPFTDREGRRWYVTGDLATQDDDGFISFRGRLRRFLKAGGEMISLPSLEEPFASRFPPTRDGPRAAVDGIETEGGRKIVLFTTEKMTLGEANAILEEAGFRGVMRLNEVVRLENIPVLGTGKIDYKRLHLLLERE